MDQELIDFYKIKDRTEKEIIGYIHDKGRCTYGEIAKGLTLSVDKTQKKVFSLIDKGVVRIIKDSRIFLELNKKPG